MSKQNSSWTQQRRAKNQKPHRMFGSRGGEARKRERVQRSEVKEQVQ